jgi:hypothetical protein
VPTPESLPQPPLFSILLPSRNRLASLKFAVESILAQSAGSWEIVISDNCSSEDYRGYVALLGNPKIRLIRTSVPIPLTDNWNNALAHATGRYVIMLGDDDALSPDCLSRLEATIAEHAGPDLIFSAAYHYLYPGTIPARPDGYLATVAPLHALDGIAKPTALPADRGRFLAEQGLKFRNLFGYDSQHMVWKKDFIGSLAHLGPFFQSPYPHSYSSLVSMRLAQRIVIDPRPAAIIGFPPKSLGDNSGTDNLSANDLIPGMTEDCAGRLRAVLPGAEHALGLPGDAHYKNWLLANLTAYQNLPDLFAQGVDLRRYRRIQILWMAHRYVDSPGLRRRITRAIETLSPHERRFFDHLCAEFRMAKRIRQPLQDAHDALFRAMHVQGDAHVRILRFGLHADIRDALAWLSTQQHPLLRLLQCIPRQLSARRRRSGRVRRRVITNQFVGEIR